MSGQNNTLDASILAVIQDGFDVYPMIWGELNIRGVPKTVLNDRLERRLQHLFKTYQVSAVAQAGRPVFRVTGLLERIALESNGGRTRRGSSASTPGT